MSYFAFHSMHTIICVRAKGLVAALCAGLMTTACAGSGGIGEQSLALFSPSEKPAASAAMPTGPHELMKATDYWRKEYMKGPKNKDAALNYARNLKALGQKQQALSVLQHAANFHSRDTEVASEYGRLALDLDQVSVAKRLLSVADDPTRPDWRVISARGTVLAKEGQYDAALGLYQRALELSPGEASVLNNIALAYMMNGDSKSAETILRQAIVKGGPHASKAKQNLALALGVQGKYGEATSVGASAISRIHAAANADYLKKLVNLAPTANPALATQSAHSYAQGPLTPDQIIAQATAASQGLTMTQAARTGVAKLANTTSATASVVRTVAKANQVRSSALPFKPSSF